MTSPPNTKKVENDTVHYLLQRIFPKASDVNAGIVLICAYIIAEFGSIVSMYSFLNYQLRIPFLIATVTIFYAVYLIVTRKVELKSGIATTFTVICLFIIIYSQLSTKIPYVRDGLWKSFSFYLSAYVVCIASIKRISQFILVVDVWLASILFSSFHGIMQGGLVWGNKWIRDENELALLVAMALPYALTFCLQHKSKIKRFCYLMCIVAYLGANIVASSRGGMISIAIAIFFFWLILKKKFRNFLLLLLIVVISLNFAPPVFFEEMKTLQQGTEEATADSRLYFWTKGLEMFYDHPFFGVGPENYPYYFPRYDNGERFDRRTMRPIHSFPIQWLAEMGGVGFGLLLLLQMKLLGNWRFQNSYVAEMASREDPEDIDTIVVFTHTALIVQITFWGGALFLSLMSYPFYWFAIFFSDVLRRIMENRMKIAGVFPEGEK